MVSRMPGASSQPQSAMEIIVESAALYSISALVYIPMITSDNKSIATYVLYPDVFFAHMAVESYQPYLPAPIS